MLNFRLKEEKCVSLPRPRIALASSWSVGTLTVMLRVTTRCAVSSTQTWLEEAPRRDRGLRCGRIKDMTSAVYPPIKLFQFRACSEFRTSAGSGCKLETWLRITRVPYEIVEMPTVVRARRASCRSSKMPVCALPIRRGSSITW